jgi:type I restriction enzyme R subunit
VTAGRDFTPEQREWLGYIREHLIENLTIAEDDLDLMPVFEQRGGLGRARWVFVPDELQWFD